MAFESFLLLQTFRGVFEGTAYRHRVSTSGDRVAIALYEDLFRLGKSVRLNERIEARTRVVNRANRRVGILARRGDGTFGELVPVAVAITEKGFAVGRGPVATIEIGAEAKILAKAMVKQIDRVIGDLCRQATEFRKSGGQPICVGIVGVNHAAQYTSFEGDRPFATTGRGGYKHPVQEASVVIDRLQRYAAPAFDEFLLLRFVATNTSPFAFEWVNEAQTQMEYAAMLTRISREYDRRFP